MRLHSDQIDAKPPGSAGGAAVERRRVATHISVPESAEHTPESALECLILASEQAPDDSDVYRAMHRLLARSNGWEGLRLKALSYLSLRERNNWRLGLELGVTDCRAFRVRQGLEELLLARDRARTLGQGGRFEAALAGLDGSGHIRRLLQHEDHTPANA